MIHSDNFNYAPNTKEKSLLRKITVPLNRINVPSWLFGSIEYQHHPIPVSLDGIPLWYSKFFDDLSKITSTNQRFDMFTEFMDNRFCLSDETRIRMRIESDGLKNLRPKVHYRRLILGWLFDSDNQQGAAWRGWVESRFGLLTNFYNGSSVDCGNEAYWEFRQRCQQATHNTNELYEQLDLLYYFCQQELKFTFPSEQHITLYRGCTDDSENFGIDDKQVTLFNNLSSFTSNPESALLFGSSVYEVNVPLTKIACYQSLLPDALSGENEYVVIGGLYTVNKMKY
ncbi:NAD(+)--dinitrogen-reductase ADP-D-ribosyltransferase [Vibrio salinus]|uniref:NAD(+)--dinitrogen-reductase ADP-D-ribosyltransferase n=1 Tax=Vibrio salinus TaxID=2899784 RepID=UPI001E5397C0|nr:NAD(+)--dinitrogen-reductase ADP-D-ribosyltransferase [Vibrio salinus]MCE0495728.1 NAD(+)--dinitrogen-reductase ADP-D-ribosyltransferase [Vibrio salinus]